MRHRRRLVVSAGQRKVPKEIKKEKRHFLLHRGQKLGEQKRAFVLYSVHDNSKRICRDIFNVPCMSAVGVRNSMLGNAVDTTSYGQC